jgi:hypothetical protein
MSRGVLKAGVTLAWLLACSAGAWADDPTGVLLQLRGMAPRYPGPGPLPAFTEGGVCYQGMHSVPQFNGYRCVRDQ